MTTLQDLPIEMLELVLLKSCALVVDMQWESAGYKASGDMYHELAKVWSEWWYRITGNWFTLTLKKFLRQRNPVAKFLNQSTVIQDIDIKIPVWGLALLKDELFVCSIYRMDIFVYDTSTLVRKRTVTNREVRNPRDITATIRRPCLYVMNVSGPVGSLLWIDPSSGETLCKRDLPGEARNLAVDSRSGNVFAMSAGSNTNKIVEYTCSGDLVRTIEPLLVTGMDSMWQAVPLSTGNFVVCQGWDSSAVHCVLILSPDGQIIAKCGTDHQHSFDGDNTCNNPSCFTDPVHASVDCSGCVVVADSGNDRVCLLTPHKLVWVRDLMDRNTEGCTLGQPYRAVIDSTSGRLYVGSNLGHVHVLQVYQPPRK